ncbi:hypothetical protein TOPH_05605 [Tolypocladium ophioglossoides CBS 100239]|uniref:LYR motif-containing protein Cup1-like N-terminal domain-containing protein n=1 Tax=Tolypocladium ophioglossoides (strain CBS 100239) TaxID=1163406 RepID=A0A0L0N6F3_TOLOC|nr:hypothetical protein TOPH_05605 [Tolypocladium ophioglossoides CBS 100239]
MPAPTYPLPSSLPPLHLYRHLLRESSYLPPAFRPTIVLTIRDRFHRNCKHDTRAKAHLSRALSALRSLRAANSGDKKAMEGLISKGFARTGSRRRELMAQFVKPQGPNDSQALEALLDKAGEGKQPSDTTKGATSGAVQGSRKPQNVFFQKWDQPKLLQILQSQKQHQKDTKGTTSWPGTAVKGTDQDQFVPKLNIWGIPPVEGLVRAKRAHWWRRSADKIMPPLGRGEWDLLGRLSTGAQDGGEWAIPERRHSAKPLLSQDERSLPSLDWEGYATNPAAVVEKEQSRSRQRRSGRKDTGPYGGRERSQAVSSRWFRRAYNRTWQLTPSMSQDPNTLRYSFAWGTAQSKLPAATKAQLEVFEGVDKRGHKLDKGPAS